MRPPTHYRPTASICAALSLLIIAATEGKTADAGEPSRWRKCVNRAGRYAISYPVGWHIFPPSHDSALHLCNYPVSTVAGGILPERGATIHIQLAPRSVKSLGAWIEFSKKSTPDELSRAQVHLYRGKSRIELIATEIISRGWGEQDIGHYEEDVDCFFDISDYIFRMRLSYWKGDPDSKAYVQAMHGIAEHLTLLGTGDSTRNR